MRRGGAAIFLACLALSAEVFSQGAWHGTERPTLKATDVDGQAAELLRHAETFRAQARFPEAYQAASDALELLEKRYGRNDARLVPALHSLGGVFFRQARHKEVEPFYLRAAAILEKGADRVAYADALSRLADLYHNSKRSPEAVAVYRRALPIYERAFGEDRRLQTWLIVVANAESHAGNQDQAYRLLRRARSIAVKDSPLAAAWVDMQVSQVLFREARFQEAADLQRAVLSAYEARFGPQHESLRSPYLDLARSLDALGRTAEADAARERSRRASLRN